MTPITVLISDDEPLAVSRLAEFLNRMDGVSIVGQAFDGKETLKLIEKLDPNLILLDIEMPGLDGFDIIEHLSSSLRDKASTAPLVIFVTAYPQFAIRAFETGALDFIPKPVRYARLVDSIDRARIACADREAGQRLTLLGKTLDQLRKERSRAVDKNHYLWVPRQGEMVRVDYDDINWVKAEREYVHLYTDEKSYLYRQMIGDFVNRNGAIGFLRVHRSAAVNVARIVAIKRNSNGGRMLRLINGDEIPVGRKYAKKIMAVISSDIE